MPAKYSSLAQPFKVGRLSTKNRIWMSPLWTRQCNMDGEVTPTQVNHYVARAKGGTGLINLGSVAVDPKHLWKEQQNGLFADKFIPAIHELIEAVHMWEVPIICQLHHAGMFGKDPVAPSDIPAYGIAKDVAVQPRVLTIPEIEDIRDCFIHAAVLAEEAGFDGVELHNATGYILEQFLSPHNNRRTDKYGGSLRGRMRLAVEIVRGIKKQCHPDFPLFVCFPATDLIEDGIVVEESLVFAKTMENEGVSVIDLTISTYETFHAANARGATRRQEKGLFDLSEVFKKAVNIPVVTRTFGQINPDVWEDAVGRGAVDAVFVGRQSWTDPEVFNKVLKNSVKDIRPCVNCNYCNETGNIGVWRGDCAINPGMGRSETFAIKKADAPKKVLVIGGGPGGMEAARVAAYRGHKVTLMEMGAKLGGTVLTSYNVIGTEEYLRPFIEWEERQCKKLGVKIQLNKKVTAKDVAEFKPDAVIVATGATPYLPPELGAGKANMVIAEDVINGKSKVSGKVVVVGGAVVGVETAELIVAKGMSKDVTVLEKLPMAMLGGDPVFMAYFMQNVLPNLPINILTNMNVVQITGKAVIAYDKQGKRQEFKADYVVMATGYIPDRALYDSIKGKYADVYNIGDSRKPRRIMDAVHEAYYFAQQI